MTDHVLFPKSALSTFEDEVFSRFLVPALSEIRASMPRCVDIDSAAIRCYTPYARNMGDIDLFFPSESAKNVLELARQLEVKRLGVLEVANPNGFFRLKYHAQAVPPGLAPPLFIIDFHVGTMFQNNIPIQLPKTIVPNSDIYGILRSISGRNSTQLPLPNLPALIELKTTRMLGHDDIDIFALLLHSTESESSLNAFQSPSSVAACRAIAFDFQRVCARFTAFYFVTLTRCQLEAVAHQLQLICGARPRPRAIDQYEANLVEKIFEEAQKVGALLSEGKPLEASIAANEVSLRTNPLDSIASDQFSVVSQVLREGEAKGGQRRGVAAILCAINDMISAGSKLDDRMQISFAELKEHYEILLLCSQRDAGKIRELFYARKSAWKSEATSVMGIASYLACATFLVEHGIRDQMPSQWPRDLAATIVSDIAECHDTYAEIGPEGLDALLGAAAECFSDISTSIQLRRSKGKWLHGDCLEKIESLRSSCVNFACVSKVLDSIIRLKQF